MISINIKGVERTIETLKGIEDKIPQVLLKSIERIAELGKEVVEREYGQGGYGNTDYQITIEPIENGLKLVAFGADVGFLEFGGGDTVTFEREFADQIDFAPYSGSWSKEHAQRYWNKGWWWYNNERITAIPPTSGMWLALKEMQNRAEEIIKEEMENLLK